MKFFPLVWAMLWRSKARTWLTFLSIVVAFVLFALLHTLERGFFQGVRLAGDDRLIVTHHQGVNSGILPVSYLSRIETVVGVREVQLLYFLGGHYQDPKNQVQVIAIDGSKPRDVDTRAVVPPEQFQTFLNTRNGAIAGRELAARHGWKIGDRIPIISPQRRKDGASHWEFELVGILHYDEELAGAKVPANFLLARYDFVNEAIAYPNWVMWYIARLHDPKQATQVGLAIDRLFANSSHETKTQLESEFQMSFLRQIGDIGTVFKAILVAVFFTLVLVAVNAMMQAFRERIPELGVLKTLGFTNAQLAVLVTAEAMLLCLTAGMAGLALAALALPYVQFSLQGGPPPELELVTVLLGVTLAAALGLLAALLPAFKSARLGVTDALATQE